MKKIRLVLLIVVLTACAPVAKNPRATDAPTNNIATPTPQINTPLPVSTDANSARENVYLDSTDLLIMESYPLQFMLVLKGNLPTPCHQLKTITRPPDAQNKIVVEAYSTSNSNAMCAQTLQPFEESVPLGSFPVGHYTLWVNGKQVAEFDA